VPIQNPGDAWAGPGGDNHMYSGYHGYWPNPGADAAADPTKVTAENCFGTMDDLKTLVSTAHAKGMKVLFDYAMVHVHTESPLYAAHKPNQGQMDGWFWPETQANGSDCICGQGCSWDTQYKQCWFAPYLAHWNYTNNDARAWSVANAVAWVKGTQDASGNGADGFRCDAIKHVETSWMNDVRTKIDSDILAAQTPKQRFYMVGETYDFGNRDFIKSFINPSTGLDGQFDFPMRAQLIQALLMRTENMSDLANFMDGNDYFYGADAIMSPFLGNHDLPRIIHLAQNTPLWNDQGSDGKDRNFQNQPTTVTETEAYERVANGFALMYTNRGAPLLYYGDEYGLAGAGDPDNRRFMDWNAIAGYDANSPQKILHDRIKTLLAIRAKHPAMRRGTRATIGSDADSWVYSRTTTGDTVYVAINRGDTAKTIGGLPSGALNEEVTGTTVQGPGATIPARQTRVFSVPSH
jgi:glycosidase